MTPDRPSPDPDEPKNRRQLIPAEGKRRKKQKQREAPWARLKGRLPRQTDRGRHHIYVR